MEEAIGDSEACQAARTATSKATGTKVSDIVLNSLPAKVKKQGVKGAVYQKEQGFFEDVADRTFRTLGVSRAVGWVVLCWSGVLCKRLGSSTTFAQKCPCPLVCFSS